MVACDFGCRFLLAMRCSLSRFPSHSGLVWGRGQCSLRVWFLDRGLREDTAQHTAPRGVCRAARSPKVFSINDTKFTVMFGTRANMNAG